VYSACAESGNRATTSLFALVDVNNFYVSCERAFNPRLAGIPVVVLSNNDGCAVARSNEVKALGVKMGTPWFKMIELARAHSIVALSSNYTLYGDMSNRVVEVLRGFSPELEVYSIDESFLRVETVAHLYGEVTSMGHAMRQRIYQWTGLPVCAGFGETKTLAKFANHIAKKNPIFDGVCDLSAMKCADRTAWMTKIEVGEVWGVGRRIAERLSAMQVRTVHDLASADIKAMRAQFGVVMERTISELRGISCLELEEVADPKQQIMSSRSFGVMLRALDEVSEAVSWHVARATEKLRAQGSVAAAVHIFVLTNRFRTNDAQYNASVMVPLVDTTDDTLHITQAALSGLRHIFRDGFAYKKCGIMLMNLSQKSLRQETLFDEHRDGEKSAKNMAVMDAINRRWGQGTLRSAATGNEKRWRMKSQNRSPCYTTRWDELPVARA
jgi:DNA polymerase V